MIEIITVDLTDKEHPIMDPCANFCVAEFKAEAVIELAAAKNIDLADCTDELTHVYVALLHERINAVAEVARVAISYQEKLVTEFRSIIEQHEKFHENGCTPCARNVD